MTTSFSSDPNYASLIRDFETLEKMNFGDKLAVSEGKLVVTPHGFSEAPFRTVKNLRFGGYNRNAVASHLEDLVNKTQDLILKYNLASPDFTQVDPVEYRKLTRMVKLATAKVYNIHFEYRSRDFLEKGFAEKRLMTVINLFLSARNSLESQVKAHPQIFHALPKASIDFDARVNLNRVKWKLPRGRTPEDVLKLAESAKKQAVPTWKRVAASAPFALASVPMVVPLQFLSLFKWVIWNPVEFLIKGEVTTKSPFSWWISVLDAKWENIFSSDSERAVSRYAYQLLSAPYITDAHVDAFLKLAPDLKYVDLHRAHLGSNNLEELFEMWPYRNKTGSSNLKLNFGPIAKKTLENCLSGNAVSLNKFADLIECEYDRLQWLDDPNHKPSCFAQLHKKWLDGFQGDIHDPESRQRFFIESLEYEFKQEKSKPLISAKNLVALINTLTKSKKCLEVNIPKGSDDIPAIEKALRGWNYGAPDDTYSR